MKKLVVVAIFIIGIIWGYIHFSNIVNIPEIKTEPALAPNPTPVPTATPKNKSAIIPDSDRKELYKKLSPELLETSEWNDLNDFMMPVEALIEKRNQDLNSVLRTIQKSLPELRDCLKIDFCGMEKDENDPYFDPNRTHGHLLMERFLEISLELVKRDVGSLDGIDENNLFSFLEIENMEIQLSSLKLLLMKGANFDEIMSKSVQFSGESKGEFYKITGKESIIRNSPKQRKIFVDSFVNSIKTDSPHNVISILEKLNDIDPSENELMQIAKSSCYMSKNRDHNWTAASFYLNKTIKNKNFDISLKQICSL